MDSTEPGPLLRIGVRRHPILLYAAALAGVALAYLFRWWMDPILGNRSAVEVFLVAVAFAAWFGGFGPALAATLTSVVMGTWSFIPPRRSFWIHDLADQVEAAAFLFAALAISWLFRSLRGAQTRAEKSTQLAAARQSELAQEVRQRADAERELQALSDKIDRQRLDLQAVLDAAPVAIWVAHDRECRQVTGNRLAHSLFGEWEGSSEVRVRKDGEELPPEERPLRKAVATARPVLRDEFELVRADGHSVRVLSNAVPLLDERGGVRGAVSIWADVTGLKEAEAEVRRLNADLERRVEERTRDLRRALDQLSSYAYSIAHDLRSPLRAMAGMTHLLVEENRDRLSPASCEYARRITNAAQRMDEMIFDLLKYARISRDAYPVQDVDPHEQCSESLLQLSDEMHRRSGEAVVEGPMDKILGHRELVREVFDQLLSNALKFVPAGVAPRIRVWSSDCGKQIRIWVEDNGTGILPEYRERIFGVFQKLQPREESPGTGIGLAIVRRAIERMEGACGVESEVGHGSRFWIELPKARRRISDSPSTTGERAYLRF